MLRGIWASLVLVLATAALAFPAFVVALLVPRWNDVAMLLGRVWSRIMLRTVGARVSYHGLSRALEQTPCIFAANHQSQIDIWALARVVPVATRFAAKRELFRIPLLGWVLATADFVPIDRSNRAEAMRSLGRAVEQIRRGRSLVLFPEGARSRDGRLRPFKKGPFHVAVAAGVPVVPVAIRGSFDVLAPGSLRVRPGAVDVFFEPAIDVAPYGADGLAELVARVHGAIAERLAGGPAH